MDIRQVLGGIWPTWEIVEEIGEGAFGMVYKARQRDLSGVKYSAIKVTMIPGGSEEPEALLMEGYVPEQVRVYLEDMVRDLSNEINNMESVKGNTNIVSIEDSHVGQYGDELHWYMAIRMELLTPLSKRSAAGPLAEEEVIRLGIDLCNALTVCRRHGIVHRDIKPENIFVNDRGDYKLGDFGVARRLERLTTSGLTRKGTYSYMAPEVFHESVSAEIDAAAKVDIYSLGLVMYQLMNNGRLPFLPVDKQLPSPEDRQNAVSSRMKGCDLPEPRGGSPELKRIILRACAYDPARRYQSAEELGRDLKALLDGAGGDGSAPETPPEADARNGLDEALGTGDGASPGPARFDAGAWVRRNRLKLALCAAITALLAAIAWYAVPRRPASGMNSALQGEMGKKTVQTTSSVEDIIGTAEPVVAPTSTPGPTESPAGLSNVAVPTSGPSESPDGVDRFCGTWIGDGVRVEIWRDGEIQCRAVFEGDGERQVWEYSALWYDDQARVLRCGGIVRTREIYSELFEDWTEKDWEMDDLHAARFEWSEDGVGITWSDDGMEAPVALRRSEDAGQASDVARED